MNKIIICALAAGVIMLLFLSRSVLLFIPVGILLVFWLWRRGGGQINHYEDEDPADWWKKDRSPRDE